MRLLYCVLVVLLWAWHLTAAPPPARPEPPSWYQGADLTLTPTPYEHVYNQVMRGEKFIVLVKSGTGTFPAKVGWSTIRCDDIPGVTEGRWEMFLFNGVPSYQRIDTTSGVVVQQPFRNEIKFHGDHSCPSCGYESPPGQGTWIVRGYSGSFHLHTCPQCGTTWKH